MDEAKMVCKLSIVVLKVGFGVLITWAVTRNTGVLIFAKMMSQKRGSVRLCVESGAELSMSRGKKKKKGTWSYKVHLKKHVFVAAWLLVQGLTVILHIQF